MRVISFILAIHILLIALVPCGDENGADMPKSVIAFIVDGDHDHSGIEKSICSPLCTCSCCSAHVRIPYAVALECYDPLHNTLLIKRYIEKPVLDPSQSIWQPPRA